MPELDKWQKRQAQELADAEDITYEHAVSKLFPSDVPEAPADAEAEGDGESTPTPKVSTTKASGK